MIEKPLAFAFSSGGIIRHSMHVIARKMAGGNAARYVNSIVNAAGVSNLGRRIYPGFYN